MDGVLSYGAPEAGLPEVEFSRTLGPYDAAGSFSGDGRIYATFPMEGYRGDEVFVKWYRSDDPEILLFDRYLIQREADYNYVWLDNETGWREGEYRVEFYSADEAMEKIAVGRYDIDPRVAALRVE